MLTRPNRVKGPVTGLDPSAMRRSISEKRQYSSSFPERKRQGVSFRPGRIRKKEAQSSLSDELRSVPAFTILRSIGSMMSSDRVPGHGRYDHRHWCSIEMRTETLALHAGFDMDPTTRAVAVPIYQTVAYGFDSAEHAAALFDLETEGFRYSRISNPTNAILERRVAALEGGMEALSVSSGQNRDLLCRIKPYRAGTKPDLGPTTVWYYPFHVRALFAEHRDRSTVRGSDDPSDLERLIDSNTRALYCESVGNPAGNIADISGLAAVAHRNGIPLIVDNTVATPIMLRPIEHGADIVIHSLTKFMGGHGTTIGGIIVDSGQFAWVAHAQRFPMFSRPDRPTTGSFTPNVSVPQLTWRAAEASICGRPVRRCRRSTPSCCCRVSRRSRFRVDRHVENARRVATFLRDDPRVEWINYAGFEENPYHPLVQKYLGGRACFFDDLWGQRRVQGWRTFL